MTVIAVILAFLSFATWCAFAWVSNMILRINLKAFYGQIQKLVMDNNIDRAIKLCNAEPDAVGPKEMKHLLVRANRVYGLELGYQEAMAMAGGIRFEEELEKPKTWKWTLATGFNLLSYLIYFAMMLMVEEPTLVMKIALGVHILFQLLTIMSVAGYQRYTEQVRLYLTQLRTLLYGQQGFHPPQMRPIRMTVDEIVQWRASMNGFEDEVRKARSQGDDTPAEELYEKKTGPSGVLPPL